MIQRILYGDLEAVTKDHKENLDENIQSYEIQCELSNNLDVLFEMYCYFKNKYKLNSIDDMNDKAFEIDFMLSSLLEETKELTPAPENWRVKNSTLFTSEALILIQKAIKDFQKDKVHGKSLFYYCQWRRQFITSDTSGVYIFL